MAHQYVGDAVSQVTRKGTVASHHFVESAGKRGHVPALCPLSKGPTQPSPPHQQVNKFSNPANRCIRCGGEHAPASCPTMYQPEATPSTSSYESPK